METNESVPQEEKKKKDRLFLYLFFLMAGICAVLGWLLWQKDTEVQTVVADNIHITAESEIVKRDLQNLQTDYAMLETNDVFLKAEIEEKKKLIEQLQRDAEKHKDDAYIIARLKKETKTLRDIMQHFVVEIDSLNTANKRLTAEKDSVTHELGNEKEKRNTLQTEKDKLYQLGSIIKTSGMKVTALNVRSKTKSTETSKAKRTDKIMVSFKLEENNIAPKGPRNIYIRIVMPDGKEWCDSPDADHMFTFGTSKGYYAMKRSVQYNNEDLTLEMLIKKKENQDLPSGKYHVEVTMDNVPIGKAVLELD